MTVSKQLMKRTTTALDAARGALYKQFFHPLP
jgi:hypothetical protein